MNKTKQAFTLVELIVVITIIAILGTIAFISLSGYSSQARDSTRLSDLGSMKTSLELFYLDGSKYPNSTNPFPVNYSGAIVWNQGTFGEATTNNVNRLDKIPKDPLTDKEYTYSVTNTKQEYQLAGLTEGNYIVYNPNSLPKGEGIATILQTNAGVTIATAIVTGNYNGQTIKSQTGSNCEILSVPSIISSEGNTITDLETILTNTGLVYNGYNNLPSNYTGSKYKTNGGFGFKSKKLVVYSDTQECVPLYTESPTARINLVKNLQTAYSGTIIENNDNIKGLVAVDVTDTAAIILLSTTLVNNNLGGKLTKSNTQTTISDCISGEINGETYSNITYSYPEILNGESHTGTGTEIINYGTKKYIGDISCDNGNITLTNEIINNLCIENYNWNGNNCVFNNLSVCNSIGEKYSTTSYYGSCNTPNKIICSGPGSGYEIASCNIGNPDANTNSFGLGSRFQWGNNYEYIRGVIGHNVISPSQVSTIGRGPGNYYNSTFNKGSSSYRNDWSIEQNDNLWGYTDYINGGSVDKSLLQGPCLNGYHVPTNNEWNGLHNAGQWGSSGLNFKNDLILPHNGYFDPNLGYNNSQTMGMFWSSTPSGTTSYSISYIDNYIYLNKNDKNRYYAMQIRCFKN